ncbi:MAG: hypothetical protein ACRDQ7_15085 [Haloechinothrix sp.]
MQRADAARGGFSDEPNAASADALTEAFLWSQLRTVTKTATVSLHGNIYHIHPKARPETPEPAPAPATGIAYLHLVADAHRQRVADDERIGFHALYPAAPEQIRRCTIHSATGPPTARSTRSRQSRSRSGRARRTAPRPTR